MNYRLLFVIFAFILFFSGCISPQTNSKTIKHTDPCNDKRGLTGMDSITKGHITLQIHRMERFAPPHDKMLHYKNWKKDIIKRIESRKSYLGECYPYSEFKIEADKILEKIEELDKISNEKWVTHLVAEKQKQGRIQQRKEKLQGLNPEKYSSVYIDKNIEVKIIDIYSKKDKPNSTFNILTGNLPESEDPTFVDIAVTVINQTKIIYIENVSVWGYEEGSDIGGTRPVDFYIEDNYGNRFLPAKVSPEYLGKHSTSKRGLRPNETKRFTIEFNGSLLKSTKEFKIFFPSGSFGNDKGFALILPYSALN